MLKLLTCVQGHFWEVEEAEANADSTHEVNFLPRQVCPTCGSAAESIPDLDLAPSDTALATPPPTPAAPPSLPPLRDADGRPVVAGYEILDDGRRTPRGVLVYRAKQVFINRTVTLKVVFAKDDAGQRAWGCLRGEATALGKLVHPNIVQIFEVGERERQLFYNAVEHVDGPTLADKVQNKPLTPRQAAQVIETLARAVHAAHEKGLIHRTLKPASVLVAGKADTPIEQCTLKITDFGQVGRPTEGDINDLDLQGALPHYLSPEQAWGRVKDFGPPTDIWALGAILYELLTGRPPFVADDWTTLIDKIQAKEVAPPSQIQRRIPPDLDAICRKCLAKNPRRRYASALALADDLRRFLDGYPVRSRPTSHAERLTKWIKRRPLTAAFVLLTVVAVVATLTAYLIGRSKVDPVALDTARARERRAQQDADSFRSQWREAERREQAALYFRRIAAAAGTNPEPMAVLNECPTELRHWEWYYLRDVAQQRGGLPFTSLRTGNRPVLSLAYSADGHAVAVGTDIEAAGDKKAAVHVWDPSNNLELLPTKQFDGPVEAVAFNSNGDSLAAAVAKTAAGQSGSQIVVRRVPTGDVHYAVDVPEARVTSLQFSRYTEVVGNRPSERFVRDPVPIIAYANEYLGVSRSDGKTLLHRAEDGGQIQSIPITFSRKAVDDPNRVRLAFGPNSKRVAVCSQSALEVQVWDSETGRVQKPTSGISMCLAYNTEERLAIGGNDGAVLLFDATMTTWQRLYGHSRSVNAVAFSRDGKRLATASTDKTVKVWDVDAGLEILTLKDLPAAPVGLAFSADGHRLAVAAGTEVRIYGSGRP